jgi:hypothetical protein
MLYTLLMISGSLRSNPTQTITVKVDGTVIRLLMFIVFWHACIYLHVLILVILYSFSARLRTRYLVSFSPPDKDSHLVSETKIDCVD